MLYAEKTSNDGAVKKIAQQFGTDLQYPKHVSQYAQRIAEIQAIEVPNPDPARDLADMTKPVAQTLEELAENYGLSQALKDSQAHAQSLVNEARNLASKEPDTIDHLLSQLNLPQLENDLADTAKVLGPLALNPAQAVTEGFGAEATRYMEAVAKIKTLAELMLLGLKPITGWHSVWITDTPANLPDLKVYAPAVGKPKALFSREMQDYHTAARRARNAGLTDEFILAVATGKVGALSIPTTTAEVLARVQRFAQLGHSQSVSHDDDFAYAKRWINENPEAAGITDTDVAEIVASRPKAVAL